MNMRLLGAKTIQDITPEMVDASNIGSHAAATPGDRLYDSNCALFVLYPETFLKYPFRRKYAARPAQGAERQVETIDLVDFVASAS